MKILQVHNYYQQAGGEDAVVEAERALLEEHGHQVVTFYKTNDLIARGRRSEDGGQQCGGRLSSVIGLLRVSVQTIWNHQTYREFRKLLRTEKPDVVHCHNTFPLISPSIYWACAKEGVPVVQTLHNYRLLCATPFLFREAKKRHWALGTGHKERIISHKDTKITKASPRNLKPNAESLTPAACGICELCVGKRFPFSALRYRCYRNSLAGTIVWAAMVMFHRWIGTWSKKVTAYIALTEFQKQKMIEGGLPEGKIFVKPNFIQIMKEFSHKGTKATEGDGNSELCDLCDSVRKPYCLFVGRLSPEKGCDVLIRAWARFQERLISDLCPPTSDNQKPQLLIVGDGPERESLEQLVSSLTPKTSHLKPQSVHFLGLKPKNEVLQLMHSAQFLVLPSLWYEGFPMTIVEAFSQGCPVVASNIGSMTSVIGNDRNGILFSAGDDEHLAKKIEWAFSNPDAMHRMGECAKIDFESKFSAEVNYDQLIEIYGHVLAPSS